MDTEKDLVDYILNGEDGEISNIKSSKKNKAWKKLGNKGVLIIKNL